MKKPILLPLVISIALAAGCKPADDTAEKAAQRTPEPASAENPLHARVDKIFAEFDTDHTPGCALSVMQKGEIVYKNGYGMANLEHDIPIEPDSVFHIASISKQFTVFAVALLVEQGKVSWDDDVHKYFPEMPDYGTPVTLRHLAHNISGIRDQWSLLSMAGWRWEADLVTQQDAMRKIVHQKNLNFKPGDNYLYSNSNFTLLAEVVHRVTGQTLREFTAENIFKPLQMNNTHFHDDHEMIVKNRTDGYLKRENGEGYKISNPDFATVGPSSLFTTVEDMAKWDKNFYTMQIGSKVAVPEIGTPGVLNDGTKIHYARAMFLGEHRGLKTIGHSGADAGYRTQFLRYPEQEFSVVVFCNSPLDPGKLAKQVAEVYLDDQMEPAPEKAVAVTDVDMQSVVGTYVAAGSDLPMEVTLEEEGQDEGNLKLGLGYFKLDLTPLGGNKFEGVTPYGNADIEFTGNGDKKTGMKMEFRDTRYSAARLPEASLAEKSVSEYVGAYYSDELEQDYTVSLNEEGKPTISYATFENVELAPKYADGYSFTGSFPNFIKFTRDGKNKVNGFQFSDGRSWKVSAKKLMKPHQGQ